MIGAHLVQALRQLHPETEFEGVAGPNMIAAGVIARFPMEKLAVRGYVEVLRHIPEILGIRKNLRNHFLTNRPDLFIGIDAPDFNLGLEEKLKDAGIPTVHLISPSIWAWRGQRIKRIARAVSHMLLLFPFEKGLYDKAGVPATYVGHPLADVIPDSPDRLLARQQLKLDPETTIFALLPGSRQSEVKMHGELFVNTAKLIARTYPQSVFVVPLVTQETERIMMQAIKHCNAESLKLVLIRGQASLAMTAANIVLVASGTATLEAALLKRPMVITYRVPWLTALIMWPRRLLPYIGLPNILANAFIVPEILQNQATPARLASTLLDQLSDLDSQKDLMKKFTQMHHELRQNSAQKAAEAIVSMLEIKKLPI